ncbi:hypothetical protein QWZ08_10610 [Ferruginibacter paludis]|uniref:hypothetical protein n=1 Tax=Ferruginibacter paludis TaxID=1310417 RepID=UPI0025B52FF4|nr:hypothetical protein [Ferruginibacter paludis]MDN3656079.1 hypothetical protein [Ferruginibacter paludis]
MDAYINKWAAIIELHENGFTEDFVFSGSNLLWVQQKVLLSPGDITLIESYHFGSPAGNEMQIFAVVANYSCVKGILITRQKKRGRKNTPVINSKLIKINSKQLENDHASRL